MFLCFATLGWKVLGHTSESSWRRDYNGTICCNFKWPVSVFFKIYFKVEILVSHYYFPYIRFFFLDKKLECINNFTYVCYLSVVG